MTHNQREPTPEEQFGQMVRAAREGYAWSQETLSRRLKDETSAVIDQSGIARIEAGRRAVRLNEVVALAQVLGLEMSQNTFAVQPDMDEKMLARAQEQYYEIQREMRDAFEVVRAQEAALETARAHLVELRAAEALLNRRLIQVLEYRRALDDLNGSLKGESDGGRPGETVREAVERMRMDAVWKAHPPEKRRGADDGDR